MMIDKKLKNAFLTPKSIAIVGASANEKKTSARIQRFLVSHGYSGKIFPINPNREEVFGLNCYSSLTQITGQVDHVFIAVDGEKIISAIKDAISIKATCATILSGGFSEAGEKGVIEEKKILNLAKKGNLRILGPNSIGLINITDSVVLSANAMLELKDLKSGGLSVISQSGSLIGALLSHGNSRDIGFSKLISVGNETDLSVGEIGHMLVEDESTDTILLFLETLRNRDYVASMARAAQLAGKSVIVYKLGKSELGQELAKSHTGALAGSDVAFNAFIKHIGVARVHHFETLIEAPNLFRKGKVKAGKRIGVVTTTGGGGAMVIDSLSNFGIEVVEPGLDIANFLSTENIPYSGSKLIDLTIAGTKPGIVSKVIELLMKKSDIDLVLMVVGSSAKFRPDQAVNPLIKWKDGAKPLAVYIAPDAPDALKLLSKNNIACFRTPESCADGINAFLNLSEPRAIFQNKVSKSNFKIEEIINFSENKNLTEKESLDIFKLLGINVVQYNEFMSEDNALSISTEMSFPLVMKVLSNQIIHKTNVGGIKLNIQNSKDIKSSFKELSKIYKNSNIKKEEQKFLIQRMEFGLAEVILGYRVDDLVGPIVVIGSGGTLSEIYDDKSVRVAPVEIDDAIEMINEVKSLSIINGYRNMPKGDILSLADSVVSISKLAFNKNIKEAEINPLIVKRDKEGVVAVDGLIILKNNN